MLARSSSLPQYGCSLGVGGANAQAMFSCTCISGFLGIVGTSFTSGEGLVGVKDARLGIIVSVFSRAMRRDAVREEVVRLC